MYKILLFPFWWKKIEEKIYSKKIRKQISIFLYNYFNVPLNAGVNHWRALDRLKILYGAVLM